MSMASDHMMELINYGGAMVPRGYAYQLLLNVAKAQGHAKSEWPRLADRWMQGYELKLKLRQCGQK